MSILDKAKGIAGKVVETVTEFSSDEIIANTIIKAVEKQEKINSILKSRGANYRVSGIDLQMGIPPVVVFGVRRIDDVSIEKVEGNNETSIKSSDI